ncbi:MAG: DUF362 domain-containing protein, partial [Planctomycetota bacterium]
MSSSPDPRPSPPAPPKVALVRCEDYEPDAVHAACREALDLIGGLDAVVGPGERVLLKPNMLSGKRPERAVTTHPAVVRAMVGLAREAGAEAWVGDSPGGLQWNVTGRVLAKTGIGPAAKEAGAELKDFDGGDREFIDLPEGAVLQRFALARPVLDADAVVSLAKLKTHGQALYTGAVKNLLGCVPGGGKIRVHQLAPQSRDLAAALLDIYAVVRPRLALIDGIVAMEGNGPTYGDPRHLGLLIASTDAVAADAVACHLIGYKPRVVHILGQAEERGLGVGSLDRIEVVGERLDECVVADFRRASNLFYELIPPWLARVIGRTVRIDPEIVQEECRRCGLCERSCPAQAIG